jgi:predicted Zn finger-like uncharacterized protein
MKFLCPNCKAKYRIGAEKLVGRQAAKIRCRKCDYRIQITRKPGGDGYDVTATATSVLPSPPGILNLGATIRSQGVSDSIEEDDDDDELTAPPQPRIGALERRPAPAALPLAGLPLAPLPPAPLPPAPLPPAARPPTLGRPVPRPFAATGARPIGGAAAQALDNPAAVASAVAPPAPRPAPSPLPTPEEATQAVETAIAEAGAELPKEDWFVGVNGVPLGPIPLADLCELAVAGHVDRRSLVWREGFDEWKPLGKLPELLRVVDRVAPQSEAPDKLPSAVLAAAMPKMAVPKAPAVPVAAALVPPVGAASPGSGPPPPPSKTANGASVRPVPFAAIPRPGAETMSKASIASYTPIEDEDDDEEAPTTVKPRVSSVPEAPGPPPNQSLRTMTTTQVRAVPVMPPPPGVGSPPTSQMPLPGGAVAPFAAPVMPGPEGAALAVPLAQSFSSPFPVMRAPVVDASPPSISATPNPLVDDGSDGVLVGPRKSRTRTLLLPIACFVLGVGLTAWVASYFYSSSSEPSPAPGKALSPTEEKPARDPAPAPSAKPAPDQADEGVEIIDGPLPSAPARPSGSAGAAKPTGQVTPAADDPPSLKPGLLAGLNRLGEPPVSGPSSGPASRGTGAGGLDSTAIQQTVARYKPSVQRGCWQPALSARAPGAPGSARVSVSLTVDGSGRVTGASTGGDPRGYPGLARCIESRVRGWRFPRSSGTTSVAVPFVFAGQ